MKKGSMKKAVAAIAVALGVCIATAGTAASAAGKKESLYGDSVTISNVTSTKTGLPEECREAEFNNGVNVLEYLAEDFFFNAEYATTYYCDGPVTVTLSAVPVNDTDNEAYKGVAVGGLNWWWWDGDALTNNMKSHVSKSFPDGFDCDFELDHEYEYFTGDLIITEPGTYLFTPFIWDYLSEGMVGGYGAFCVIVSGSKSAAPAPTVAVTPAPSKTAAGDAAALKTADGLVKTIPANPAKGEDLSYKVQKGEKLFTIAYNYYGSMQKSVVDRIYQANAAYFKGTKGVLKAGAVLTLPAEGLITPVTQSGLDKAAGMYLVKSGDTLADIAKTYYGDSRQWNKIYEANKDRVKMAGKSPMIYEGQWLVIPE